LGKILICNNNIMTIHNSPTDAAKASATSIGEALGPTGELLAAIGAIGAAAGYSLGGVGPLITGTVAAHKLGKNLGRGLYNFATKGRQKAQEAIYYAPFISGEKKHKYGRVPHHLRTDIPDNYKNANQGINIGIINGRVGKRGNEKFNGLMGKRTPRKYFKVAHEMYHERYPIKHRYGAFKIDIRPKIEIAKSGNHII
jgi:hypothetical protein